MSANRLTVACCIVRLGAADAAFVIAVEPPRPLHRSGAKHQRAARVPVERQRVRRGRRARKWSRSPAAARRRPTWCPTVGSDPRAGIRWRRPRPIRSQACRRTASAVRRAPASRPPCCARSAACLRPPGPCNAPVPALTREERAGQRVLGPAAVGRRAEARILPGAGPHRRAADRSSRWRAFPCSRRACGTACAAAQMLVSQRVFQNTSLPLKNARLTPAARAASTLVALAARPVLVVTDRQERLVLEQISRRSRSRVDAGEVADVEAVRFEPPHHRVLGVEDRSPRGVVPRVVSGRL